MRSNLDNATQTSDSLSAAWKKVASMVKKVTGDVNVTRDGTLQKQITDTNSKVDGVELNLRSTNQQVNETETSLVSTKQRLQAAEESLQSTSQQLQTTSEGLASTNESLSATSASLDATKQSLEITTAALNARLSGHDTDIDNLRRVKRLPSVNNQSPTIKSDMVIAVDVGNGMQKITFLELIALLLSGVQIIVGNKEMIRLQADTHGYMSIYVNGSRRAWIGFGDVDSKHLRFANEYCGKVLEISENGVLGFNGKASFAALDIGTKNIGEVGDYLWGTGGNGSTLNGSAWVTHRTLTITKGKWIIDCGYVVENQSGKYLDFKVFGNPTIVIGGSLYCQDAYEHSVSASAVISVESTTTLTLRAWTSNGMTTAKNHYLQATKIVG